MGEKRILVINTGSTSTKLAVFNGMEKAMETTLRMDSADTAKSFFINDQLPKRMEQVENFIKDSKLDMTTIDMIASRGGPFPPTKGGAYAVNKLMADVAHYAPSFEHASALSCQIAYKLGQQFSIPAIIYDSISNDEMPEVAKVVGLKGERRASGGHVLNVRACARKVAKDMGIDFNKAKFVVAHVGGGVSVTTVDCGLITDSAYNIMSPERLGDIQTDSLVELCYSGQYTYREMKKLFLGSGGFVSLMGTSDALKVENMALAGDEKAMLMYDAMAFQLAKSVGCMTTVVNSEPDAIIFTGALARSSLLMDKTIARIKGLGKKIVIIPGEMELEALAGGALRVLAGEEEAKEYTAIPSKFADKEDFYNHFPEAR